MDNFPLAFAICGVACLVGAAATAMVFPPSKEEANEPFTMSGFLRSAHVLDRKKADATG